MVFFSCHIYVLQYAAYCQVRGIFDILVGVIIMGIYVYRIKETFDSIDTDSLRELKE